MSVLSLQTRALPERTYPQPVRRKTVSIVVPCLDEELCIGDFVMGSRFKGYIEPGAMPALHQYFGTPVTTWVLNQMYGTRYSDIHCGMRAMTREALHRIQLESQSWEYASEMVLKAARLGLKI